jgi:hypothetical protein
MQVAWVRSLVRVIICEEVAFAVTLQVTNTAIELYSWITFALAKVKVFPHLEA